MKKAGMVGTKALPLCLIFLLMMLTGCAQEAQISYSQDVKPILDQNCIACHQEGGEGLEISGLSMMSHADLMKGAQFGPMIIAGDSEGSNLIVLMEGRADPSISMPHGTAKPVKKADIETIRVWIDQGAKNN